MRSLWLLLCNLVAFLNKLWEPRETKLRREIANLNNELFHLQDRRTLHHDRGEPVPLFLQDSITDCLTKIADKKRELRALEGE